MNEIFAQARKLLEPHGYYPESKCFLYAATVAGLLGYTSWKPVIKAGGSTNPNYNDGGLNNYSLVVDMHGQRAVFTGDVEFEKDYGFAGHCWVETEDNWDNPRFSGEVYDAAADYIGEGLDPENGCIYLINKKLTASIKKTIPDDMQFAFKLGREEYKRLKKEKMK